MRRPEATNTILAFLQLLRRTYHFFFACNLISKHFRSDTWFFFNVNIQMQPTKLNRSNDFRFFLSQFFFFTFLSQHWSCLHTREFFILICSQFVMQYHQISVTYYGIFSELIVSLKSLCLPHEIFTDFRVSSCNEQFSSLGIFFSMCAHEIGPEYIELSMTCLVK